MQEIDLPSGLVALVDDADYAFVGQWKWCIQGGYVGRSVNGRTVYMHRVLMNPPNGMYVDHINRNKLDNRRQNLRLCQKWQNAVNATKRYGSVKQQRYRGVMQVKGGRWRAHLTHNKTSLHLGVFDSAEDAALAYNEAAKLHHGEFAQLNTID